MRKTQHTVHTINHKRCIFDHLNIRYKQCQQYSVRKKYYFLHRFTLDKTRDILYNSQAVADLAHLVERHLAKVEVASSSLVIRSKFFLPLVSKRVFVRRIYQAQKRRCSQVVRQGSATPSSPVQIWVAPPKDLPNRFGRSFFVPV